MNTQDRQRQERQERRREWRNKMFDKFFKYRRGVHRDFPQPVLPVQGRPPPVDFPETDQIALAYQNDPSRRAGNLDDIPDRSLVKEEDQKAWDNLQYLKNYFAGGQVMRYRKCLGWGGNGLAAAFDRFDAKGNRKDPVVRFLKAEHITQLIYVHGEGLVNVNQTPPYSSGQGPSHLLFMTELLENGDLSQLIANVRQHKEKFPNAILWRFLIRMCIAMAYPPAAIEENRREPRLVRESVHTQRQPTRVVHFDFDPKNIFIGQVVQNSPEHNASPILKLGDFGIAAEIQSGREDTYYEGYRKMAKQYFFAPEQFCADWNYIPHDLGQVASHPIAGNYGIHTNIYAVGSVMECLITHAWPAWPPKPTSCAVQPPEGKQQYHTYAGHLWQPHYRYVDRDLVSLIMRMQAHLPADRPTLQQLETAVVGKVNATGTSEAEQAEMRQWMQRVFYDPPPPPRWAGDHYDDVEKTVVGAEISQPAAGVNGVVTIVTDGGAQTLDKYTNKYVGEVVFATVFVPGGL
ncbi:kinase-like domain-containing protein [Nemania sp. NC0429]|nr:kinase-like domain-containing protein [Nemania sp. NC0429]